MKIPLTKGKFAIIDPDDYELVSKYKWHAWYSGGNWYARANYWTKKDGKLKCISLLMHRLILNPPSDMLVDHINGNGLDNRRSNLRCATHAENMRNRHRSWGTSKYKGVRRDRNKWRASIRKDKKDYFLGYFSKQISAALAYDKVAIEMFGEFARTNFPQIIDDRIYDDLRPSSESVNAVLFKDEGKDWLIAMPMDSLISLLEKK